MPKRLFLPVRCTALAAVLALAACQQSPSDTELATLDNQITGNEADPALTSALEDQIATDPTLRQQSNSNAVRPPQGPVQAQYPPSRSANVRTSGANQGGAQQLASGQAGACAGDFDYNMAWARRLPPAFPVFPGGRVTDAAGNARGACRVVTFASDAPPQRVVDWYGQRASDAGYTVENDRRDGDLILAGANERGGGAYYLIVTPVRRGGSDVAIIVNSGG